MPQPISKPKTTPIYSFAALKTKQREIKDRAAEEIVHITENGNAAFIFCSEEVFELEKIAAVEAALYELRVSETIRESRADYKDGRFTEGLEEGLARMNEIWAHHG